MPKTITVGPVTRVEGHLDIQVTLDVVDGVQTVVDARSSGTMFRGFEEILKGRNPRDAIHMTQRICGICPTSHAVAASKSLEAAYGRRATPPDNGRILRNLLLGADFVQSHILSFYQLAIPDYVDNSGWVQGAPCTASSTAPDMISGQNAKRLVGHYLEAIGIRRKTQQLGAPFGGRMPCSPVFVAGGCTPSVADVIEMATVGQPTGSQRIEQSRNLLQDVLGFIENAYLPDVQFLAERFPEYLTIGRGCGSLLAFGAFDLDSTGSKTLLRRGVYTAGTAGLLDPDRITEHVKYSRYGGATTSLHPSAGTTQADAAKLDAYSWIKAPRYRDIPHEVGPLARMWISGLYRRGVSVMDRLIARALEARKVAEAMVVWLDQLNVGAPSRTRFKHPSSGTGVGLMEAPRGALGHWVQFRKHAIQRYQVLTPTAWNASPMDDHGQKGPMEQALIGTPVCDKDQPMECLRVVHSLDPCLACSAH